jgi:hypothetical protein
MLLTDPEIAYRQEDAFASAADASPIPQIAAVLAERAREWRRAAQDLELVVDQGEKNAGITFVGSIEAGIRVVGRNNVADVLRVIRQGGDISLQVNDDGIAYLNFVSAASPVVVVPTVYRRRPR